ncbi:MAG: hypothetical protein RL095_1707 [Verrucomicrobiota bacterium]|jgi:multidrug efflux pump subunit AcrB
MTSFLSRHRRASLVLALICAVAGFFALSGLEQRPEPKVATGHLVIRAAHPGVPAQALEEAVGQPLDQALRQMPGLKSFRSQTWNGLRLSFVEIDPKAPSSTRQALEQEVAELRSQLAAVNPGLRGPAIDAEGPDAQLAISLRAESSAQLRQALPALLDTLAATPGVASSEVLGAPARRICVRYKDADLARTGLSPIQITGLIRNHGPQAPGAYLDDGKTLFPVHADIRLNSLERLKGIIVPDPIDSHPTTLDRLLDITLEDAPAASCVLAEGKPAVCLLVSRHIGEKAEDFSRRVLERLQARCAELKLPKPQILLDSASLARHDAFDFNRAALAGLAAIALLLTLVLGFRNGLLVTLMVPLSILSTFAVLQALGASVDLVTLGAVTIAIGIVTDNHLVVVQAVARRLQDHASRDEALTPVFRLLGAPLAAATVANAAGFLPASLADHPVGQFLQQLAPVLAIALAFSYLYAFALTPFLAGAASRHPLAPLEKLYEKLLTRLLPRAPLVLLLLLPLLLLGPWLLGRLPLSFFPEAPRPLLIGELRLDSSAAPALTRSASLELGQALASKTGQSHWTALCGQSLPAVAGYGELHAAGPHAALILQPFESTAAASQALEKAQSLPVPKGCTLTWRLQSVGPRASSKQRFEISGSEAQLAAFQAKVGNSKFCQGLRREYQQSSSWRLVLDQDEAAKRHITPADTALALSANLHGLPALEIHQQGENLPVLVLPTRVGEDNIERLKDAFIYPARGEPCLLSDVAKLEKITEPACLEKKQGQPMITLVSDYFGSPISAGPRLAELGREFGLTVEDCGVAALGREASQALYEKIPLAAALIFIALILQSGSLRSLLVSLSIIPLGLSGAALALKFSGVPLSFMAILGITAMAGLALNIAIVLAAAIRQELAAGGDAIADISRAAASRLEPVLLSTLCAFAGAIPLAFTGDGLWLPLALALIGGLIAATLGGLLLIPLLSRVLLGR